VDQHTVLLQSINQLQFILRIPVYPVCWCYSPSPPGNDHILVDLTLVDQHTVLLQSIN
jgi:hypothetical protein